jgi:DNA-binding LytR/AlgR family response regulator
MYTCVIIDDQKDAIDLILDHVNKIPELSVIYYSTDPVEALNFIDKNNPDVIFLDIEMPDLTGLDIIDSLRKKRGNNIPKVIFTTGYNEYAIQGFELGVSDYILKPVTFKRFKIAVDRILSDYTPNNNSIALNDYFFIDYDNQKIKISYSEIIYVEGARNYVIIATKHKNYIIYRSLKSIIQILPSGEFLQVHKSYIISVNKIKFIQGNRIILNYADKEKEIPLGFTFKSIIYRKLNLM